MPSSQDEEIFTTWTKDLDVGEASVIGLCGELDASSAPTFLNETHDVVKRRRNVIMDVNLLSYTDSTGLSAILSIKNALQRAGKSVCLVGCHGILTKILYTISAEDDVKCYDNIEDAIGEIGNCEL